MAEVRYAARALSDLERFVDFFVQNQPEIVSGLVARIREAVSVLEEHPLIGRPAEKGFRELVISRGWTGYLALYRFLKTEDVILVLAFRHQREAMYAGEDG